MHMSIWDVGGGAAAAERRNSSSISRYKFLKNSEAILNEFIMGNFKRKKISSPVIISHLLNLHSLVLYPDVVLLSLLPKYFTCGLLSNAPHFVTEILIKSFGGAIFPLRARRAKRKGISPHQSAYCLQTSGGIRPPRKMVIRSASVVQIYRHSVGLARTMKTFIIKILTTHSHQFYCTWM